MGLTLLIAKFLAEKNLGSSSWESYNPDEKESYLVYAADLVGEIDTAGYDIVSKNIEYLQGIRNEV